MAKLPLLLLYKRLDNEIQELKNAKIGEVLGIEEYCSKNICRVVGLQTINGYEELVVVRKYRIMVRARGFERTPDGDIVPRHTHVFDLYILRNYPFPDSKIGAPIRIVWVTPIFHPNIAPGIEAGGKGIICWRILQEWLVSFSLKDVVSGIKDLIENPNPDNAILLPETRLAAEWFSRD